MFDSSDLHGDPIPSLSPASGVLSGDPGGDARRAVAGVVDSLRGLVATLHSGDVLTPDAVALVEALTQVERLGGVVRGRMAVRAAESPTAVRARGDRSAGHWLARVMGSSVAEAVAVLETARRLADQPLVSDVVDAGGLSARQAAMVTSTVAAVTANAQPAKPESTITPEAVSALTGRLLAKAPLVSNVELAELCAKVRAEHLPDAKARHDAMKASRSLRWKSTLEGAVELFARGTPDDMAEITNAIRLHRRSVFERARREGRLERSDAHDFDALLDLARSAADPGVVRKSDGESSAAASADPDSSSAADTAASPAAPRSRRRRQGPKVMIRIDEADLHRAADVSQPASAEVVGHGPIPASRVVELVNEEDAEVHAVVVRSTAQPSPGGPEPGATDDDGSDDGGGEVVGVANLGRVRADGTHPALAGADALHEAVHARMVDVTGAHDKRSTTAAQATALDFRDPVCCVQGCDRADGLETDHRTGWVKTHTTGLNDLDRLCRMHHRLKTRFGHRLAPGSGKRPMLPP